ncbi:MAG: hypothetical protein FWG68_06315, partial [Defluviitaleaceae bacterium]|nr:hypothetical protein [Defluviitaleaceae bacterium]
MLRVTSSMMTNNMMVNVNRGMRNLDALSQQFFSNSKIITPSDNPIIAARAMQFRTNLVHNANFQTNVDNGLAWMDVTESAIDGLLQVLMLEARDLVHRAANDPMALEDRGALMTALNSIFEQIGVQMNSQFAGRFVFSGLRTDQPPVLNQNQPDISHRITQVFDLRDVERTRSLQIFPQVPGNPVQLPLTHDIHILKLAYNHVDRDINGEPILDIFRPDGTTFNIIMRSLSDPTAYDASTISPGEVIYIPETGELVFHPEDVTGTGGQANFPVDIQFTRSGFTRGELNPLVYFTTTQKLTRFDELIRFDQQTAGAFTINPDGTFTIVPGYTIRQDLSANAAGMVQLAYNSLPIPDPADPASSDGSLTNFTFVPASFDIITQDAAGNDIVDTYDFNVLANSPADLGWSTPPTAAERNALANGEIVLDPTTGQLFMNDVTAANFNNIQVVYEKDTFLSTDRIPTTHPAVMAEGPRFEGLTFTMDNQDLEWEF